MVLPWRWLKRDNNQAVRPAALPFLRALPKRRPMVGIITGCRVGDGLISLFTSRNVLHDLFKRLWELEQGE